MHIKELPHIFTHRDRLICDPSRFVYGSCGIMSHRSHTTGEISHVRLKSDHIVGNLLVKIELLDLLFGIAFVLGQCARSALPYLQRIHLGPGILTLPP
jgi:hypothetical protein